MAQVRLQVLAADPGWTAADDDPVPSALKPCATEVSRASSSLDPARELQITPFVTSPVPTETARWLGSGLLRGRR